MATSVTSGDVTWTFAADMTVGQYVTGDWWVVGPVSITMITPMSTIETGPRTINGSMLNPVMQVNQGLDTYLMGERESYYVASLNVGRPSGSNISAGNPLNITTGSLISGISIALAGSASSRVRVLEILTVVSSSPATNSFRPPYVGTDKVSYHVLGDVSYASLPSLTAPASAPAISTTLAYFNKSWIEHMTTWLKELSNAPENLPNYGREIADQIGEASLQLCLDINQASKESLANKLIQIGIDYYAVITSTEGRTTWEADGGHMSGRVFPILLAGLLLSDSNMLSVMDKSGDYAYSNGYYAGNLPADYRHFGEVDQTFHITQRDIDLDHSPNTDYPQSMLGVAEYGIRHANYPENDDNDFNSAYREVVSPPLPSYILSSLILSLKSYWNHDSIFDYTDRYAEITGGWASTQFFRDMWSTYRGDYGGSTDIFLAFTI